MTTVRSPPGKIRSTRPLCTGRAGWRVTSCGRRPHSPLESACCSSLSDITPLLSLSTLQNQEQLRWRRPEAQDEPEAAPTWTLRSRAPPEALPSHPPRERWPRTALPKEAGSSLPRACLSPRSLRRLIPPSCFSLFHKQENISSGNYVSSNHDSLKFRSFLHWEGDQGQEGLQ